MLSLKKGDELSLGNSPILPTLESLMEYTNPHVLDRYSKDHPNNKLTNKEAFADLMKYFWLCQKHKIDSDNFPDNEDLKFVCAVHKEMKEMDDMWHTFLLFTMDYADYCEKYFGEFIHHMPTTDDEEMPTDEEFSTDLTRYLSYIYDQLGEETVRSWFAPLLEETTAETIEEKEESLVPAI